MSSRRLAGNDYYWKYIQPQQRVKPKSIGGDFVLYDKISKPTLQNRQEEYLKALTEQDE